MVGAVVGSPGTMPTNWNTVDRGLTREIVEIGTENGIEYIDVKYSGTASATAPIDFNFETTTAITASAAQSWANSFWIKKIAVVNDADSYAITTRYGLSGGGVVSVGNIAIIPTALLNRFSASFTTPATTERVQPRLSIFITNGQSYDFTIRIGLPQMELGTVATSPIKTTTSTATRSADNISLTGASDLIGQTEGFLYALVDTRVLGDIYGGGASKYIFSISDGTISNRIRIVKTALDAIVVTVTVGGAAQATFTSAGNQSGIFGIAVRYGANDFSLHINGATIGTDTSGTVPACTDINIGKTEVTANTTFHFNDHIFLAGIGTTAITESQALTLSSLFV
jgi:hypothetical protein